jgi:CBS domain containing-hemolysin-like protein
MYPFIWLLNGSANGFVRIFGLKPAKEHDEAHSEEELRIILSESYESGKINKTEYGYVSRIFAFDDLLAREIMVPRTDMVCLYLDKTLEENLRIIKEEQYTRFPVVRENKDNIVGMINTKQFFLEHDDNPDVELSKLIHPVLTVPESIPVKTLLKKMQQERTHIAILVDEYGGTSGMITIEDILEEIVGEIRDEFDTEEKLEIEKLGEHHFIVDGKVSLSHINDLLNTDIESEGLDTIGGWLYGQNTELKKGSEWRYHNLTFIVREKEKHRIRKVEIIKHDYAEEKQGQ